MRAFAEGWPDASFMHQPDAKMPLAKSAIMQQPVAQLPWGHHTILLNKLDAPEERLWYAAKAVEHGWSRDVLALQIDSALHLRQGKSVSNFKNTLPPPQSDLAQQITKDPYLFDFLNLRDDANERAVEAGLLAHVEKFLLELGVGFALVGRQIHMEVGEQDFYLDLLFYHLKLRCFVVVDLLCGRPHNKSIPFEHFGVNATELQPPHFAPYFSFHFARKAECRRWQNCTGSSYCWPSL
jgi:predicted nuclease of restriction endonuclease-like (RecB) superfamily